jgi:hypothetical protein
VNHLDNCGGQASHGGGFGQSFRAGIEWRAEPFDGFACLVVVFVVAVERGNERTGIQDVFHPRFFVQERR